MIGKNIGKGKAVVFPIKLMRLLAITGDLLKYMGWTDPPITTFRLNNMLTGSRYPLEKTQGIVEDLPFTLKEGVNQTLCEMHAQGLIRN